MCNRQVLFKTTHITDILFMVHGMYNGTGAKEQQCFKECMRHYMKNRAGIGTYAQAQEHITQLTNRRISQYFFNIVLL